jgi:Ca2+-binding RTX toxin-like protein
MALGLLEFSSFEHLRGGTSSDLFQFALAGQLSGNLNGDFGGNTLDYSPLPATMPVRVNLAMGTASRVAGLVTGIANAGGGSGNDILVGNAQPNTLTGNGGRDLIIGGLGIDILTGGAGEDLLIGGKTQYDLDPNALAAIMAEWSSSHSYGDRRKYLLGQLPGGLNGTILLSDALVADDFASDQLTGGDDMDWFWADFGDTKDQLAGEKNRTNP